MKTDSNNRASTQQFLINCLRGFLNSSQPGLLIEEDPSSLKIFPKNRMDWNALLQLASWHKIIPLLYRSMITARPDGVPENILNQLKEQFDLNLRRNLRLTGELLKVLNLFETHGIQVIPYKGPVLASYLYGNLALRQFIDLDILVRKEDVLKAKELLIAQGYQPLQKLNHAQEATLLRTNIEYVFYRTAPPVSLEVHWRVDLRETSIPLDFESLWARCEPLSLAGRTVLHPPKEDLLLILCAHTSKHILLRLTWICDVAQLLRVHQGMDWNRVLACAKISAGRRLLFPVLILARDLLGAPLPDGVWQKVQKDPAIRSLAAQMKERLFREPGELPGVWESNLFQLKLRQGVRDRLMYCVRLMAPTSADWDCIPLPEPLFPLYYLLRPMRLTAKYTLKGANYVYNRYRRLTFTHSRHHA